MCLASFNVPLKAGSTEYNPEKGMNFILITPFVSGQKEKTACFWGGGHYKQTT